MEEEVLINLSYGNYGAMQQRTNKPMASGKVAANGAGLNDGAMLQEAYRKAAEDLTLQLVEAINAQWGQELTAGHPIQLT